MTTKSLLLFAAVALTPATYAQQAATTQATQQPTVATTPCKPPAPPHKPGWIEKKVRDLACKKDPNMCNLPSSPDDVLGTTPCTPSPAPKTPPATPAPAITAPIAKPAYVCPPRTVLIANTAYCLAADHSTVDAIPLPPNQPLPPAK